MDRSADARFPERCPMTQLCMAGPLFVDLWMIRLKKAISDLVESTVRDDYLGAGLAVLMPGLRLFKETLGVDKMQLNKVEAEYLCFVDSCFVAQASI
jgi:hypothetical protein